MVDLVTYRASDRRVYNGALCSDMEREQQHTRALEERMKAANPSARCTYFPMEGMFLVFTNANLLENPDLVGPPVILTNNMHYSKQAALIEAILVLESNNQI